MTKSLIERLRTRRKLFRRRFDEQFERDVLRHEAHLFEVEPLTNAHSFGDVFEPDENFFGDGLRAAQPNLHRGRFFAHACKSRRAPRPRKPDETLSRHGLGARRVALLAPRGVLSKYRHPLSYAGAITKYFVKFKSKSRILGDENSIPSGGGVPEGRWGSLTPMSGDGSLFISLSTPLPSERAPLGREAYSKRA